MREVRGLEGEDCSEYGRVHFCSHSPHLPIPPCPCRTRRKAALVCSDLKEQQTIVVAEVTHALGCTKAISKQPPGPFLYLRRLTGSGAWRSLLHPGPLGHGEHSAAVLEASPRVMLTHPPRPIAAAFCSSTIQTVRSTFPSQETSGWQSTAGIMLVCTASHFQGSRSQPEQVPETCEAQVQHREPTGGELFMDTAVQLFSLTM